MSDKSLHDEIHETLVIEEPEADALLAAVEGCVQITDGNHSVLLTDEIHNREPAHRVMTYLLGRYCAARLSDGDVSAETDRADLIERLGHNVVGDALAHAWIDHWGSRVRLRPRSYDAVARELARRYNDD